MRLALLFSGQGNLQVSHLERLRREAADTLQQALAAAIPAIWQADILTDGMLQTNRIAQPVIYALQMHLWSALREQLPRPACMAGYSLGEVAACAAAGLFAPEAGIALCSARARLMDACVAEPAGMVAVNGLDAATTARLAAECGLAVAIRNGDVQFVLAGPRTGLDRLEAMALAAGAVRVAPLSVTTPSHTPLLAPASQAFLAVLEATATGVTRGCLLSAIDGRAASNGATARAALAAQISTPMDWARCLDAVAERQPDAVLEIGPGTALARMWNERATGIPSRACDEFRTIDGVVAWVLGQPTR